MNVSFDQNGRCMTIILQIQKITVILVWRNNDHQNDRVDQIREIKITFAERSFWYLNDGHFGRQSFWITIILIFENGHFRSLPEMYRSNYLKWAVISYTRY